MNSLLQVADSYGLVVIRHFVDGNPSRISFDDLEKLRTTPPPEGKRGHTVNIILDRAAIKAYVMLAKRNSDTGDGEELLELAEQYFIMDCRDLDIDLFGKIDILDESGNSRGWSFLVDFTDHDAIESAFESFLDQMPVTK